MHSALIFEKLGYQAIGTSSAAIASSLGLEDGEKMHFSQLVEVVKSIVSKINLPLTVDLEGGYSRNIDTLCANVHTLAKLGVVGINLEDSITDGKRKIVDAHSFTNVIQRIKSYLDMHHIQMFVNIRTDFYIMGLDSPLKNTLKRIKLYEQVGIDGIFVPCITDLNDIEQVVSATKLPINVMSVADLIDFNTLSNIGVKRVSTGPFNYHIMMQFFEKNAQKIINANTFDPLFQQ
ncbi:Probable carboxyvinyl-carboxyphosphonate phosphorylmutase [hydrothermal vent metagenome]|uniref:Probable carboxyvinyl-carboxyphosphonate phosphorylmutase n=1 Tax=hydrothermal vent metagenome TaxID=652676 RepID=A0A1W1E1L3_9ZZZZ